MLEHWKKGDKFTGKVGKEEWLALLNASTGNKNNKIKLLIIYALIKIRINNVPSINKSKAEGNKTAEKLFKDLTDNKDIAVLYFNWDAGEETADTKTVINDIYE